jgi:hypothetical protein
MKHVYYKCNATAAHSIDLGSVVGVTVGSQFLPRLVQNWLCGSRLGRQIVVSIDMAGFLEIANVGIQGTLHLLPHLVQPHAILKSGWSARSFMTSRRKALNRIMPSELHRLSSVFRWFAGSDLDVLVYIGKSLDFQCSGIFSSLRTVRISPSDIFQTSSHISILFSKPSNVNASSETLAISSPTRPCCEGVGGRDACQQ